MAASFFGAKKVRKNLLLLTEFTLENRKCKNSA